MLVLPELCLTEELAEELTADALVRQIPLVALGSYHTPGKGPGFNRCRVLARGVEISVHDKLSDFFFDDAGICLCEQPAVSDGGREPVAAHQPMQRHEHLVADAERAGFELLLGAHSTAVVLICKDALDARVEALVRSLAPNLVLIPAMTPKLDSFQKLAEQLSKDPQAFTLISSFFQRGEAILGRPVEGPALHEMTERSACIFMEIKDLEANVN